MSNSTSQVKNPKIANPNIYYDPKNVKPYSCKKCGKKFSKCGKAIINHVDKCTFKNGKYHCPNKDCTCSYKSQKTLNLHVKEKHSNNNNNNNNNKRKDKKDDKKKVSGNFTCPHCEIKSYKTKGKNYLKHIVQCKREEQKKKEEREERLKELEMDVDDDSELEMPNTPELYLDNLSDDEEYWNPKEDPDCCAFKGIKCKFVLTDDYEVVCSECHYIKTSFHAVPEEDTEESMSYQRNGYNDVVYHNKLYRKLFGYDDSNNLIYFSKHFVLKILNKLNDKSTWKDVYNVFNEYKAYGMNKWWLAANQIFDISISPLKGKLYMYIEQCMNYFKMIEKQNINYWYVVYKVFELWNDRKYLRSIPLKINKKTLKKYDVMWKRLCTLCNVENWRYIPTKQVPLNLNIKLLKDQWDLIGEDERQLIRYKQTLLPQPQKISKAPYPLHPNSTRKNTILRWEKDQFNRLFKMKDVVKEKLKYYMRYKDYINRISYEDIIGCCKSYYFYLTCQPILEPNEQADYWHMLMNKKQLKYDWLSFKNEYTDMYCCDIDTETARDVNVAFSLWFDERIVEMRNKGDLYITPPPPMSNKIACERLWTIQFTTNESDDELLYGPSSPYRMRGGALDLIPITNNRNIRQLLINIAEIIRQFRSYVMNPNQILRPILGRTTDISSVYRVITDEMVTNLLDDYTNFIYTYTDEDSGAQINISASIANILMQEYMFRLRNLDGIVDNSYDYIPYAGWVPIVRDEDGLININNLPIREIQLRYNKFIVFKNKYMDNVERAIAKARYVYKKQLERIDLDLSTDEEDELEELDKQMVLSRDFERIQEELSPEETDEDEDDWLKRYGIEEEGRRIARQELIDEEEDEFTPDETEEDEKIPENEIEPDNELTEEKLNEIMLDELDEDIEMKEQKEEVQEDEDAEFDRLMKNIQDQIIQEQEESDEDEIIEIKKEIKDEFDQMDDFVNTIPDDFDRMIKEQQLNELKRFYEKEGVQLKKKKRGKVGKEELDETETETEETETEPESPTPPLVPLPIESPTPPLVPLPIESPEEEEDDDDIEMTDRLIEQRRRLKEKRKREKEEEEIRKLREETIQKLKKEGKFDQARRMEEAAAALELTDAEEEDTDEEAPPPPLDETPEERKFRLLVEQKELDRKIRKEKRRKKRKKERKRKRKEFQREFEQLKRDRKRLETIATDEQPLPLQEDPNQILLDALEEIDSGVAKDFNLNSKEDRNITEEDKRRNTFTSPNNKQFNFARLPEEYGYAPYPFDVLLTAMNNWINNMKVTRRPNPKGDCYKVYFNGIGQNYRVLAIAHLLSYLSEHFVGFVRFQFRSLTNDGRVGTDIIVRNPRSLQHSAAYLITKTQDWEPDEDDNIGDITSRTMRVNNMYIHGSDIETVERLFSYNDGFELCIYYPDGRKQARTLDLLNASKYFLNAKMEIPPSFQAMVRNVKVRERQLESERRDLNRVNQQGKPLLEEDELKDEPYNIELADDIWDPNTGRWRDIDEIETDEEGEEWEFMSPPQEIDTDIEMEPIDLNESVGNVGEGMLQRRNNRLIGRYTKPPKKGGDWGKILLLDYDLSDLGIYNETQLNLYDPKRPCLIPAIKPQLLDLFPSHKANEKIQILESLIKDVNVYKRHLKIIVNYIMCDIELTEFISRRGKYNQQKSIIKCGASNCEATIYLGLFDDHYFRNDIMYELSTYAIRNYEKIKHKREWWKICKISNKTGKALKDKNQYTQTAAKIFKLIATNPQTTRNIASYLTQLLQYDNIQELPCNKSMGKDVKLYDKVFTRKCVSFRRRNTGTLTVFNKMKIDGNNTNQDYFKKIGKLKKCRDKESYEEIFDSVKEYRVNEWNNIGDELMDDYSFEIQNQSLVKLLFKIPHGIRALAEKQRELNKLDDPESEEKMTVYTRKIRNSLTYLKQNINDNIQCISYQTKSGRDYSIPMGIQRESRVLRSILSDEYYYDIDMTNAHYYIAIHICKSEKYKHDYNWIENYTKYRTRWIDEIIELNKEADLQKCRLKKLFLTMLYGGNNIIRKFKFNNQVPRKFDHLHEQIRSLRKTVISVNKQEFDEYKKLKPSNAELSFFSKKLLEVESKALNYMIEHFKDNNLIRNNVYTKIFDGFQIFKYEDITEDDIEECIESGMSQLEDELNIYIPFRIKEHEAHINIQNLTTKEEWKKLGFSDGIYKNKFTLEVARTFVKNNKHKFNYSMQRCYNVVFFDFETDVNYTENNVTHHKEYCVSYCINDSDIKCIYDINCVELFLEDIPNRSLLIAHNLNYDYRFIAKHPDVHLLSKHVVYFNNKFMAGAVKYKEKILYMKCSFQLISHALSKFPKIFNLNVEKEAYPYELYSIDTMFNENDYKIKDALKWLDKKKQKIFLDNIKKLHLIDRENGTFNHKKYAEFYCNQDVYILREGYNKFRKQVFEITQDQFMPLDIDRIISSSSLGERYAYNEKVFEGVVQLKNVTRGFIQKSVQGGACRAWCNKKIIVKGTEIVAMDHEGIEEIIYEQKEDIEIVDYDACSLYPSAMYELEGIPIGKPVIASEDELKWDELKEKDACFMKIKISKVNKHRNNPIMSITINDIAYFDDRLWKGRQMIVSHIKLKDLIEYHKIEFEIIEAIYWNNGINKNISTMIKQLYDIRLEYKKQKNPLQSVIKLIMNSIFGKTLIKASKYKNEFVNTQQEYYNMITCYTNLINVIHVINEGSKYRVQIKEDMDEHINMCHIGSLILDQSKHIMNRVMCLAEDLGILILYQDTDSMHLNLKDVPQLEKEYKKMYNRELNGKQMSQFHSDFSVPKELEEKDYEPRAIETIIVGKKAYYDKIQCNSKGDTTEHYRLKGISKNAMDYYCEQNNCTIRDVFHDLYLGKEIEFDLANSKPVFKFQNDMTVSTLTDFKRKVSFKSVDTSNLIINNE